jgi:hypothetical protein
MNPNDATIRRIYTRKQGGAIVDESLAVADANELVVEWEAGSVFNSLGVDLTLVVATRNVVTGANVPAPLSQSITVKAIPANTLAANVLYETIGCLVRGQSQIHSFSNWWLFLGV